MTRNYKKAISLLMAVVMTMSSVIPCFAETQQFESIVDEIVETDNSEQTDLSGLIGEIAIEIPDSEEEIVEDEVIKDNKSEVFSIDETPAQEIKQQGELSEENSELFEHEEELLSGSGYEGIIIPDGVTEIAAGAYANLNITSIKIPDSVETIGAEAFKGCTKLESVEFGKNVKTIGYSAFSGCTSLKKAILPEGLEKLGTSTSESYGSDGVFYNCKSLEEVYIPSTLTQGYNAFYGCSSLSKVTFGEELTIIPNYLFANSGLKEVSIPDNITEIGKSAFSGCTNLASVAFSKGLKTIGGYAFSGCTSLKKVILPEGLEKLGTSTSSGYCRVFYNCTTLEEVYIPSTLTFGYYAFDGCSSLSKVTYGEGLKNIPANLFAGSGYEEIIIPDGVTEIAAGAYANLNITSIKIPDSVETIGAEAFKGCTKLESVEFGKNVKTIGYSAFSGCTSLTKIELPEGLESIGQSVFSGCVALTELSIINGTQLDLSSIFNLTSTYEWNSKDSSVAEISQKGVVSTHKAGETIITAISESTTVLEIKLTVRKGGTEEETKPVAVISPSGILNVYTGFSIELSAENSSAVGGIQTFEWDFGDGTILTGETAEHSYSTKGDYTLTLKVTDYSGNESVVQTVVNVSDPDENHTVVSFFVCDAQTKNPIKGANITLENAEGSIIKTVTDENGLIKVVLKNGEYDISIVSSSYLARYTTHIFDGTPVDWTIGLSTTSVMTGEMTVTEMTYNEIIAAGIDVNAEGNQHVWKYATVIRFKFDDSFIECPVELYKNEKGEIIKRPSIWYEASGGSGGSGGTSGGGSPDYRDSMPLSSPSRRRVGVHPINEKYVLIIYGETRWLKEMYQAELVVTNHSAVETLEDVTAEIDLPEGLSLADMLSGQQSRKMTIDKVPEDSSDSFIWYLRGDKEGEYNVSVDVTAKQMPFGDEIHCHYTTDKPVKVYAGSQMKMTITADNKAIEGYYYHVNYKLENVSPKSLYNLCLRLNSAEQWAYEDTSITVGDIPEWSFPSEGEWVLKRTDALEDYVSVDELAPGQTVEINMKVPIDFIDGEDSPLMKAFLPEKVEFLVKQFDVYTLEGSTTEIPYEIALVEPELEIVPGKDKWEDEEPTLSILKFNSPKGYYYTSKENGIKTYNFTYSFDVTKTSVDVEVTEGAEWKLYSDEKCLNLLDKTQTFSLNVKDNRWYIKITKGSESELYGINIYRRKKDGFDVKNQHYEESFSKNFEEYLENSANIYNSELSYLLMNFADAAYNKDLILQNYENAGFSFSQPYHYGEIFYGNTVGYVIGEKVVNGEKIVFVTVRGSVLGTGDWLSNFLITSATISPIPQKHEGFWIAADEIVRAIKLQTGPLSNDTKYVFTGHSRGAAIANLAALELSDLGVDSNNIYDYNFACPDNACELPTDWNPDGNHNNIINIGNLKDIVTFVPGQIVTLFKYNGILFQWGKFGRSYWFSDDFTNLMNYNLDFNAHNTNYYLDFLKSHASKAMQDLKDYFELVELKNRYRVDTIVKEVQSLYGIFCPVDFQVYDVNGVLYASVIDGQVEYSEADLNNDVVIFVYEDQKLIYVREGLKVDIKMIATDDGQMDFSVINFDIQTGDVLKEKLFKDVQLIEGKQMEYIASIDLNIENAELLVVEDGIPVRNISTDGTETIIKYQVIYNSNGRGTAPLSSEVECNSTIAKPENPIADGYTFAGWYKESTCENPWSFDTDVVTKDITLYAKWVENVATTANYTIKHLQENLDGNGYTEVIADRQILSGTVGEDTNASEKTYTGFTAKTVEQKAISADGNTVIEIKYERNRYTVTWKNWDETELEKDTKVPYGSTPTYDGETPTKEATAQYTYTFDGWDRTLSAVTEDVVYTAKFKETVNKYTVTFKDWDGTELKKTEVEYGSAAEAPSDPERVGYTFTGWDKAFDNITGELTVTAQYADKVVDVTIAVEGAGYGSISGNKATVKYGTTISADGAKLTVGNTTITATPTADTAQYTYSFKEWSGIPEDGIIVEEITITAVFERNVKHYTVTWKNWDETELEKDTEVPYGSTPTYDGETPSKVSDGDHTYEFIGWTPTVGVVINDTVYAAQYREVPQYTPGGETVYDVRIININNGSTYKMKIGDREVGYFRFTKSGNGWKISQSVRPDALGVIQKSYLSEVNGKLSYTDEKSATVWTYQNGAFSVTETVKNAGKQKHGFEIFRWQFGGFGKNMAKTTKTTYYLSDATEGVVLSTSKVTVELYEEKVETEHHFTDWKSDGKGHHSRSCECGEVETGNCEYDLTTKKCKMCGASNPTWEPFGPGCYPIKPIQPVKPSIPISPFGGGFRRFFNPIFNIFHW